MSLLCSRSSINVIGRNVLRRITAVAVAAAVATASTLLTGGIAQAATPIAGNAGPGSGSRPNSAAAQGLSAMSAAATPPIKPGARKHYFTVPSVTGARIRGDWYWARNNGPYKVITQFYITDTRRDGRTAAILLNWKFSGKSWYWWIENAHGAGTTLYTWIGWEPAVKPLHASSMVGVVRPNPQNHNKRTFYYDRLSSAIRITW
jgi:hypothetical protein